MAAEDTLASRGPGLCSKEGLLFGNGEQSQEARGREPRAPPWCANPARSSRGCGGVGPQPGLSFTGSAGSHPRRWRRTLRAAAPGVAGAVA